MTRQEYKDIYEVVGMAMEVYNTLGRSLDEHIYQEAFAIEAKMRGKPTFTPSVTSTFQKRIILCCSLTRTTGSTSPIKFIPYQCSHISLNS